MTEKKFGKRFLAWALTMVLTVSLLPLSALAEEKDSNDHGSTYKMMLNFSTDSTEHVKLTYKWNNVGDAATLERGESATFTTNNGGDAIYFYVHVLKGYTPGGTFAHVGGASVPTAARYTFYDNIKDDGSIGEFKYTISTNDMNADRGSYYFGPVTVTITANPIDYTVHYDLNGGFSNDTISDNGTYRHSDASTSDNGNVITISSSEPEKAGYTFEGWKLDGSGEAYQAGSTIDVNEYWANKKVVGDTTNQQGTFTLIAQWKPIYRNVTFQYNNGQDNTVKTVQHGSAVSKPDPTWEGHQFLGWYTEDGIEYEFDSAVEKDITLYGEWALNQYTVTFDSNGGSAVDSQDVQYNGKASEPTNPTKDNYTFGGWYLNGNEYDFGAPVTNDITLVANWNPMSYGYTVNYLERLEDGTDMVLKTAETKSAAFNSVIESGKEAVKIDGYNFGRANVPSLTIGENETDNVINLYYTKRSDLSYTVNYYWDGTTTPVADSKTVDGQIFDTSVAESPVGVEGYTAVSTADKSITIGTGTNEINFYYYENVELTANSDTATYDGKEHSASGFTGAPAGADFSAITVGTKGTDAGTYEAKFPEGTVGTVDAAEKYIVTAANDGQLVINPITDKVIVEIMGNSDTVTYDGTEQTVAGYEVTKISNSLYKETDFAFSGKAEVSETNVGGYTMEIPYATTFYNNNSQNFPNVDFEFTPGTLTIEKRAATITANDVIAVYNGEAHGGNGHTAVNLANGHTATATISGSETAVGVHTGKLVPTNVQIFDEDGNNVTSNYAIEHVSGTLTISKSTDVVTVTITGNHDTKTYNGREQSVTGFTTNAGKDIKVSLKNAGKDTAKGTDRGTYYMGLTADDFEVTSDIFEKIEVVVVDGYLEITRRSTTPSRSSSSTDNTVTIEDDDALGLNTTDHFAYIVGYGNGEVRPQNNITRAEVATIFFRLLTDDVRDENLTKTNRYSDVAATSWYNTAVSTLSSMGIITGYPDGTFRPNAAITRAEFAAIAARFDNDGDKTAAKFSDIATHWAKDEISIAYNNGWITGYPNGTFGPQRDITRAETMTLVNRVLNRQPETEDDLLPNMTVWTDNANPKAWYYLAVQEATNSHYYEFKTNSQYEKWTELRETRDWTQLEK